MLLRFSLSFSCAYLLWHLWHTLSFTYLFTFTHSLPPLSLSHVLSLTDALSLPHSLPHLLPHSVSHPFSFSLNANSITHMFAHSFTDWITQSFSLTCSLTYSHPLSLWFPPSHYQPQLLSLTFNPLPLSYSLYPSLGLHSYPSLPLFITLPHSITSLPHSLLNTPSLFLCNPTHFHTHSLFLTHSHSFPLSFIPCLTHSPSLTFYLSLTPHFPSL